MKESVHDPKPDNDTAPKKRTRKPQIILKSSYFDNEEQNEITALIGVDEAGRGPLFGRVYAAAVVLPKDFDHSRMKDSKKFHSKRKIEEAAAYIKEHAIGWAVAYEDEKTIDQINILQATQSAMHKAIRETLNALNSIHPFLLVDGNYFKPFTTYDKEKQILKEVPHVCVTSGDDTYSVIAAASILAKVERDNYIAELCAENSDLDAKYGINKNKGYGTLEHRKGIQMHGLSPWHRRSFRSSILEDVASISEPLTQG